VLGRDSMRSTITREVCRTPYAFLSGLQSKHVSPLSAQTSRSPFLTPLRPYRF